MSEQPVNSALFMDRSRALGNSDDGSGRGALHVKPVSSLVTVPFDSIFASYPDSVTEVFTYKLLSNTVAVVTVVYTSSSKDLIQSVVKT